MNLRFSKFYRKIIIVFITTLLLISCDQQNQNSSIIQKDNLISERQIANREQAIEIAIKKYKKLAINNSPSNGYPRSVNNSQWVLTHWQSWTDGFFPGILWQLSIIDEDIVPLSREWTKSLATYATMPSHDVGFIINNSFGKGYRLTGKAEYLPTLKTAADTLSNRFNSNIGATRSWDFGHYTYPVIIDNMMNIALLFEVAKSFNNTPFYSQAISHAKTSMMHHIRDDGTSFHLVDFDLSGNIINKNTVQGLSKKSTWARGQAWGIHGFITSYI